jgi:hypothetical protein
MSDKEEEYQAFLRRQAARGRPDLGWYDQFGRRWNHLSDIMTNPDLANPIPPDWRRKQIERADEE